MKKTLMVILCMAVSILTCAAYGQTAVSDNEAGNKIYFAGPLFSESEREYNAKLTEILEEYGYEVFLPQRDGFLAAELEGMTEEEKTQMNMKNLQGLNI